MTFEQFDKYQEELLAEVVKMKSTKGKEYANSESRFANFDRLSSRLNMPNLQIALVYFTKHMDAIESYISKGRTYSTETIQGRIVDAITYLTLIGGMIQEGEQKGTKDQIVANNLDNISCYLCHAKFLPGEPVMKGSAGYYEHLLCPSIPKVQLDLPSGECSNCGKEIKRDELAYFDDKGMCKHQKIR